MKSSRQLNIIFLLTAIFFVGKVGSAQDVFQRKLEQITFVPKGQWITGVSVSYSQSDQDKYQFLIIENLSGDTYTFKVSPMLMFAFKDNLAAGGRFAYSRQRTRLNSADVVLGSDTEYNVDNLYSISHNFSGMLAFRNYISLGRSTRFGLFNEVQLQFGGGQSKLCTGTGRDFTGTFERSFNMSVVPGADAPALPGVWLPVWLCFLTIIRRLRLMSVCWASITARQNRLPIIYI